MEITAISELVRFQNDRGLTNQEFKLGDELTNILEEVIETRGLKSKDARRRAEVMSNEIMRIGEESIETDIVDAFADIITFAIGSLNKIGYDPELVLVEVGKEVNSRTGDMINGKFIKHETEEAKSGWYKANYEKCKYDAKENNDWCYKKEDT